MPPFAQGGLQAFCGSREQPKSAITPSELTHTVFRTSQIYVVCPAPRATFAGLRLLVLTAQPHSLSPAMRYRFLPYTDLLRNAGYHLHYSDYLSPQAYQRFYLPETLLTHKAYALAAGLYRKVRELLIHPLYHGFIVSREAMPLGSTFIERLWARRLPMLLDFDDAIWLLDVSEANRRYAWLKNPKKLQTLLALAKVTTVCNDFLAAYARQYATDVRIIPTTIDTEAYRPQPKPERPYAVIGWSGSYTTAKYLRLVEPALEAIYRRYGSRVRFRFIGAPQYRPPFPAEVLPWRAETEVEDLLELDIGLMPLPDDDWSRGKCALKALQYMALEIPPVVSPVGANCTVIQTGHNGLHAKNTEDWIEKLSALLDNPDLRQKLGKAARKTVEAHYSVHTNLPKYIQAFQAAFGPA